jgi:hypothetical protein
MGNGVARHAGVVVALTILGWTAASAAQGPSRWMAMARSPGDSSDAIARLENARQICDCSDKNTGAKFRACMRGFGFVPGGSDGIAVHKSVRQSDGCGNAMAAGSLASWVVPPAATAAQRDSGTWGAAGALAGAGGSAGASEGRSAPRFDPEFAQAGPALPDDPIIGPLLSPVSNPSPPGSPPSDPPPSGPPPFDPPPSDPPSPPPPDVPPLDPPPNVTPGVPEASTWAMLLLGFGGLGFAAFRRGRRARVSAIG